MWFFASQASYRLGQGFNIEASSHGAAGECLASQCICPGVLLLLEIWNSDFAIGICLAVISVTSFCGFLFFGIRCAERTD